MRVRLLIVLLVASLFLPACPDPTEPGVSVPVPLQDFMPLQVGNRWDWTLVLAAEDGARVSTPVGLELTEILMVQGSEVYKFQIHASRVVRFLMRAFSQGEVLYVTISPPDPPEGTAQHIYYTDDPERLTALPDVGGLERLPLSLDLQPHVERTSLRGDDFYVRYFEGTLDDVWPPNAQASFLGYVVAPDEPVVATQTSSLGLSWSPTKMIFVRDLGVLYWSTAIGDAYLQDATLAVDEAEDAAPLTAPMQ